MTLSQREPFSASARLSVDSAFPAFENERLRRMEAGHEVDTGMGGARLCGFRTVAGCGGPPGEVGPGDRVGTMTLVSGTIADADLNFFDFCNPVILKPAKYLRSRTIPRVQRLLIGYGDFEPTRKALESDWKARKWDLWLDGRRVNLVAFGTYDHTLLAYPGAGGKNVILRRWKVVLVGVTPGKHTVRYGSQGLSVGTTDATWTFSVAKD
jgi:hypothetical protein